MAPGIVSLENDENHDPSAHPTKTGLLVESNGAITSSSPSRPALSILHNTILGPRSVSGSYHRPHTVPNTRTNPSDGLNVIIPMGGVGSRFQREGYRFPKPLIKIVGRPMLCWLVENLRLTSQDTLWLAIQDEVEDEFQVGQSMKKWFPSLNVRLVRLNYLTKGATETLFIVAQSMPVSHRRRRTVSLDCDTIYHHDILTDIRNLPAGMGGCFFFQDTGSEPIFSYIVYDENNTIIDIQEKKAISTNANTGAYVFPSGSALQQWANIILDSKLDTNGGKTGEYFTSQMIEEMIKVGKIPFTAIPVSGDAFSCVGTPRQLDEFLLKISQQDSTIKPKRQRFCFDLDMTLVGFPQEPGDYSTCPPIWQNIELVKQLHKAGHHIIIQTARRMRTHNGNVGAVIADIGSVTIASLQKYGIPYDELFFGKPYAHVYVDDLAVHANVDTRREIGWLASDVDILEDGTEKNLLADAKHAKKAGVIASREFNHVQIIGERVMKSSKTPKLMAEMYFYSRVPISIRGLFPEMYSTSYVPQTKTFSFTMQKVQGVSYSHLLTSRSLTHRRLEAMLQELYRIHTCDEEHALPHAGLLSKEIDEILSDNNAQTLKDFDDAPSVDGLNTGTSIYANYARKLKSRYNDYREVYDLLGSNKTSQLYATLLAGLESYETRDRAIPAAYIHGDPVLSNVVLDETARKVTFLDVRSLQGDMFTTAGDVCYDLAKVLQSLHGYDHIILGSNEGNGPPNVDDPAMKLAKLLKPEDRAFLSSLQDFFWSFVQEKYGSAVQLHDLLTLMASLLFTLIPLHRSAVQPLFLQMCANVLEHETGFPL
ncbi:hypothetical protein LTR84_001659 [Exophiala bonariae]|uniref:Mannose-1-phosphate guanyltransferase n=1 Tax=Exophiala bonariae TaxID=1690606 RepID=A0AAV9NB77_9EURO|nr:hypothetical protein LTR84_001659 [Exophiala bonariae]